MSKPKALHKARMLKTEALERNNRDSADSDQER